MAETLPVIIDNRRGNRVANALRRRLPRVPGLSLATEGEAY